MDKKKIYIGYDVELNRCLLYKKNANTYIDLDTATKYNRSEIYEESLVSYENIARYSKATTKKEIKREFNKIESEKINLDNVFVGDIIRIDKIEDLVESEEKIDISEALTAMLRDAYINYKVKETLVPALVTYTSNYTILLENRLLRKYDDYLGYVYVDVLSGREFKCSSLAPQVGDITVGQDLINVKDAYKDLITENELSKKELIRLYLVGQSTKNSAKINKKEV